MRLLRSRKLEFPTDVEREREREGMLQAQGLGFTLSGFFVLVLVLVLVLLPFNPSIAGLTNAMQCLWRTNKKKGVEGWGGRGQDGWDTRGRTGTEAGCEESWVCRN